MFAGYLLFYQKKKDKREENNTAKLNEQNIRLQWFKELIVQPNISHLTAFFENLESIKKKIDSDAMDEDKIISLNRFINDEASKFRVKFYDIMLKVNEDLYKQIKKEVEDLVTKLTTTISDDEHKLTNAKTFEREIQEPIKYSKHNIIALIYSYKGT